MIINEEQIFNKLYDKYNKLFLSKKEVCVELNISLATLNRRIKDCEALPEYEVIGGKYQFSILSIVAYLIALNALVA